MTAMREEEIVWGSHSPDEGVPPAADATQLPLNGVTVVDLSRALAGPYCTALLGDLGASVIKVESGSGDPARQWPPFDEERSLYFESTNRNKESIWIDLYSDDGKTVFNQLLQQADILIENYKFGTLAKMGFDAENLDELNPDLVHVSVSAFGNDGPLRDQPGLDQVVQAMSGLTSVTGAPDGEGYRVGLPIIDLSSGIMAAFTAVSLVLGRERGGSARRGSTSLYETALSLSAFQGQKALVTGEAPKRQGNNHPSITPYGMYATATDDIVIAVSTQRHWDDFCQLIGRPELEHDERFATGKVRTENRDELNSLLNDALGRQPAETWIESISQAGIPVGPVLNYADVMEAEQTQALSMISDVSRADGTTSKVLRGPVSVDGRAVPVRNAPPALSQDSRDILKRIGISDYEAARYIEEGIVHADERR